MPRVKSLFICEAILALLCLLAAFPLCSNAAVDSQPQSVSALHDAEGSVVSAYYAISKADAAGANVTDLLVRLNDAEDALSRAKIAYRIGDYDSSMEWAALCQDKLQGFVADADALTEVAVRDSNLNFLVTVVGSLIGSVGIVCLGVLGWVYLNRRYGKPGSGI